MAGVVVEVDRSFVQALVQHGEWQGPPRPFDLDQPPGVKQANHPPPGPTGSKTAQQGGGGVPRHGHILDVPSWHDQGKFS